MKILKRIAIGIVIVYVLIVVAFETMLGYSQPKPKGTLTITTFNDDGEPFNRVVTGLTTDDKLYVRVNHWPRAWYFRLLDNPDIEVTMDGETQSYLAVDIEGREYDLVENDHPAGIVFRILTGFPPRYIVRLDPK